MIFMHYTHDGKKRVTDLQDVFSNTPAFLVGGAPSLITQGVERLEERGVLTMAMNNAAIHFRPTLWVSGDNPDCYEPQILHDPGIMKFASVVYAKAQVNGKPYYQHPNMHFYLPDADVPKDEYLEPRRGVPWYANTLFVGIYILYAMGVRQIILAGSDFGLAGGEMYAHPSSLTTQQTQWNQMLYDSQIADLVMLKPIFEAHDLKLADCSAAGRLRDTYPHLSMDAAISLCKSDFPSKMTDPVNLPHCSKFADRPIEDVLRGGADSEEPETIEKADTDMETIL